MGANSGLLALQGAVSRADWPWRNTPAGAAIARNQGSRAAAASRI
jgi:hypothetical protein